jgi:aminoglycoside phosphotransferase (APT) family kinase protein
VYGHQRTYGVRRRRRRGRALKNTTDPEQAATALQSAIADNVEGARDVRVTGVEIPASSGLSNETVLFDAAWTDGGGAARAERLVARVQPSGPAVFPRYDLAHEFAVMRALDAHTDVPVPAMRLHVGDPGVLGAPFIVMGRVDGRVPADDPPFTATGWVTELSAAEQAALAENAAAALAQVHRVDLDAVGLGALRDHPESGLDGQLAFWRETFAWAAEGDANPTVEAALEWVAASRPVDDGPTVLSWGDARVGNMIFAADLSVAAVLDWEMACAGPPGLDVGWWLFMSRYYTEGIGAPAPPGFPERDAFVARYEEATGTTLGDLHFYEVLAATRLSILMHRAGNLMIGAGLLPAGAPMKTSNPASQLLAKLLGLPAPEGAAQSFVGNRR